MATPALGRACPARTSLPRSDKAVRNSAAGKTCGQVLRNVRKDEGAEGARGGGAQEGPNKRECHAQGEEEGRSQDLRWGHPPLGTLREIRARKQAKGEGATQPLRKQGRWTRDP